MSDLILDDGGVKQKVKRMAYEIYENNFEESEIVLAGVHKQGFVLAQLLAKELKKISPIQSKLAEIFIDKEKPEVSEIKLDLDLKKLKNRTVILVDDVLNTGKTFAYSMRPFLATKVKKIEIAVLVDRGHAMFPISANYSGYELSTTLNEHIEVKLGTKYSVHLH